MIIKASILSVAGLVLFGTSGFASAQIKAKTHRTHKTVSITGCLAKGDEAGEYAMKTSDGKVYGLTSKKVKLGDHVGHTVTLGGFIVPESSEKPEANAPAGQTAPQGDIDMTVTALKMVSNTCQQ